MGEGAGVLLLEELEHAKVIFLFVIFLVIREQKRKIRMPIAIQIIL